MTKMSALRQKSIFKINHLNAVDTLRISADWPSPEAAILLVCARNRDLAQTKRNAASGDENAV